MDRSEFDFIVVGAGAGGALTAARLAEAGFEVCLMEAGDDASEIPVTQVPLLHLHSSQDPTISWDFFVRHYASEEQSKRDPKFDRERDGVLYPRSSAIGGCTMHNAMITLRPADWEWDRIARETGDSGWSARNMARIWKEMRWLHTETTNPLILLADPAFLWKLTKFLGRWMVKSATAMTALNGAAVLALAGAAVVAPGVRAWALAALLLLVGYHAWNFATGFFFPNRSLMPGAKTGVIMTPTHTVKGRRHGMAGLLRTAQERHGLTLLKNALATRVLFEAGPDGSPRASGVEFLRGSSIYRAHRDPRPCDAQPESIRARKEVILSGGAFNTPQLLMLSGIGERSHLAEHGIDCLVDLPVGDNLQDRYEVGVVARYDSEVKLVAGLRYDPANLDDPDMRRWKESGTGIYTSNGSPFGFVTKSSPDLEHPDLYVFYGPLDFRGYYRDYQVGAFAERDRGTWAVLKAHTNNRTGQVRLRSTDPLDTPDIQFHYFDDVAGPEVWQGDLDAVVHGVEYGRDLNRAISGSIEEELLPSPVVRTREQLRTWVKDHAWGHHASCTVPMGPCLDGQLRVKGVANLRVVDACAFARIPGFFILGAIWMLAEKASRDIIAANR